MARRDDDYDDDDVPWLAEVEEERPASTSVSQRKLIGGIALFAALLALIIGGVWAITSGQREGGSSGEVAVNAEDVPLIPADPGPYKVRPADPGGMQIDGAGDTMYAAGEGADVGGALDPGALPEDPMPRPGTAAAQPEDLLPAEGASAQVAIPPARGTVAPAAGASAQVAIPPVRTPAAPPPVPVAKPAPLKPLPKPVAPVAGTPPAKPSTGSAALQLGAFSSSAAADTAWKDLTKRFTYLGGLSKAVGKVERDGKTLYRLRATGVTDAAKAADLCARLKVAGEDCLVAP
ncbi:SPOR domain-containing protein [Glacieibacterium frigidum]|uniref:SPOR domain-containing protein n=1 Tax=Glacieibacterium frigidum TaxID=2593303 RepID=A0A552UEJ4_9SPHN|nr:SPOR domain-containing protein [Glacieibacterium frigidum]TRW16656.1 hypothetical protein FMM06_00090 [Glacieibacterium frigidum]